MKKITKLYLLTITTFITINIQAQTPEWYREDFLPENNGIDSKSALTTDVSDNLYASYRYDATGKLYVSKFDPNGNMLWYDILDDSAATNVVGLEIINNSGTDYLYVAFDSQSIAPSGADPGLACYNMNTGAMQWAYSYEDTENDHIAKNFSVGYDGTLILTTENVILFLDKDGVLLGQHGNPGFTIVQTDISSLNTSGSPDADTGKFINTETNMPFAVGSPLPDTPAPTGDTYNTPQEWIFGTSYSGNDPVNGDQVPLISGNSFVAGFGFTGSTDTSYEAAILNNDGFYIHLTTNFMGASRQAIVKLNRDDRTTVEWSHLWWQVHEAGSMLTDENGNIYLITWDQLFYLNSIAADILITKFDTDGNYLWSKTYGNSTNTGNEIIWSSNSTDIDTNNQRIAINSYTDSYDSGNPKAVMLVIDYNGDLQNYSIIGNAGVTMFGISAKFDSNGNVYGTGADFSEGPARLFKINTATVFDSTLSLEDINISNHDVKLTVKDNGMRLRLKIPHINHAQIGIYDLLGRELYNQNLDFNNDYTEISGLNLQTGQIYLLNYKSSHKTNTIKFLFD